jgi:predicted RNase H-like HicB family nuclease
MGQPIFTVEHEECVYDLRLEIESLNDGGDCRYVGSSPDLPNLIVAGDTIEDVLAQAPGVARALIETMRGIGQPK